MCGGHRQNAAGISRGRSPLRTGDSIEASIGIGIGSQRIVRSPGVKYRGALVLPVGERMNLLAAVETRGIAFVRAEEGLSRPSGPPSFCRFRT